MSLYIEHHITVLKAMVQFEIEKLTTIHEEAQGNEDGDDDLVGGADDSEEVEGAPRVAGAQGDKDNEDGLVAGAQGDVEGDLVGGADDPEVVEGAPGRLLSRHHLVLPSPVAHTHLMIFFLFSLPLENALWNN